MDDLISRQAVTKFLNDWLSCLFENCHKQSASDLKMIIKDFKNLPSAQPETNCSEIPNSSDTISRQQAVDFVGSMNMCDEISNEACKKLTSYLDELPSIQSERKTGHWILDRSEAYCCDRCMEPCAGYVMMKPRDKFCKMCGAKMERRQDGQ